MASADEEAPVETVRHPHLADIGTERDDGPLRPPPSMRTLADDEATDGAFLRGIAAAPRDIACRLVYADWLEERGRHDDAEFVRSELTLRDLAAGDAREAVLRHRVRALTPLVSLEMRRALARVEIEGCAGAAACPRTWDGLRPTPDAAVRRCHACDRGVSYVTSLAGAAEKLASGELVVVDAAVERVEGDLAPPPALAPGDSRVTSFDSQPPFELPPDTERNFPEGDDT